MRNIMLSVFILLASTFSHAIPVVNENVANSGMMTIYPDSENPNRFYVAPNVVTIAKNENDMLLFSYTEYKRNIFRKAGVMSMTLVPAYTREELEVAKQNILAKNPQAEFSGMPFIESSIQLSGELPELISDNKCNHIAGLIGQEQSCMLSLTDKGRHVFYKALSRKTLFLTLQFEYAIQAVVKKADGGYEDRILNHGIAVVIDGGQLAKYPQLIHRLK